MRLTRLRRRSGLFIDQIRLETAPYSLLIWEKTRTRLGRFLDRSGERFTGSLEFPKVGWKKSQNES